MSEPVPRWGTKDRELKGQQILAALRHHWRGATPLDAATGCDLGCGNGAIAAELAPALAKMIAVDPEPWPHWPQLAQQHPNLSFRAEPVARLSLPDAGADVVVCNQVYEHVDDPVALIRAIERVLKPGGLCYFAGPNLLFPVEPHVFWPFVHWLPRKLALALMKALGSKAQLDAYSTHYWRLRGWLSAFEVENALPFVIRHAAAASRNPLARLAGKLPPALIRAATPLSPGFVFILRKPERAR